MTNQRRGLPQGRVTFVFTDIEGSSALLAELGSDAYAEALAWHRGIVREAAATHGGVEVDTAGDAFFLAFASAPAAIASCADIHERLASGPIRVRIGVHRGDALVTTEGYVGEDVHIAARVAAAAHGGQVVLTEPTRQDLPRDADVLPLGEHRFKDIAVPIAIYQLAQDPFPPLRTISNTNLPRPASDIVGREVELAEVSRRLGEGARLVTLTGPGGTGKTRLAIEVAAAHVPATKAGVFWVDLSPLRDPALVLESIAQVLGARGGLAEHIGEREMLLVLDNLEQVVDAAPALATLVEACARLRLLVTSRERLRVRGEVEYAVPALTDAEAVELFTTRSGYPASDTVAELCRRLDKLPLAIELAAARTGVLSPDEIVGRIGGRLDLLRGGRDAQPRQSTLRTTIAWSHDLLGADEQALFARLAIFRGGWTLAACEAVCDADLDVLGSLVDKSLVRRDGTRFSMLEMIVEFAAEHLEASGEVAEIRRRHAAYYVALALHEDGELRRGEPEEGPVAVLESEIDNLRAAVDHSLEVGDVESVRAITVSLPMYWDMRGRFAEGRRWLERAVALEQPEDDTRRRLLLDLARFAYVQGHYAAAVTASDEAAALAAKLGDAVGPLDALRSDAWAAFDRGDMAEAERLFGERLALATAVDNGVAMSACRLSQATVANRTGRHDLASDLLSENLVFVRSRGQVRCEANTLMGVAETAVRRGQGPEAAPSAVQAARLSLAIHDEPTAVACLDLWAVAAARSGDASGAIAILAATEAAREAMGARPDEDEAAIRAWAIAAIGLDAIEEQAWSEGRDIDLAAAVDRAAASTAVSVR